MNKRPPRNGEKTEQIQNTLLVDGNALFKSGFHGAKNVYNHNGQHIGGTYQFLTSLRMLLSNDLYHKVYVFWDGNFSGKLRYEIYKDYKIGRGKDFINGTQPIDESELRQRERLWYYLNELSIRQLKHEIIEGDDFIAYYCLNKKENEKITICSNDGDMLQLLSKDVRIYFCNKKHYVDSINYSSYYCHHIENSILLKTMTGDDSDSIKGIKGLGEPTLISLFPEIKERKVSVTEIVEKAKILQDERLSAKKGPLKVLFNIANSITDGIQGNRLYEINYKLVNLKEPMLTEDGITELDNLINGYFDPLDFGLKNVMIMMKQDGLDNEIGSHRYPEYLLPFKKLNERELKTINNN